jgi:Pentapeptide repeats (8 copies)
MPDLRKRRLAAGVIAGAAVAWLFLAIVVLPEWIVGRPAEISAADLLKAKNDVRTILLQATAAAFLAGGLYFTAKSYWLTREGQITDRFTKAVDQLDKDKGTDVRLGGIYALQRIARDSTHDRRAILSVLGAYAHERSPWASHARRGSVSADVQAAVSIMAEVAQLIRHSTRDPFRYGETIDLRDLDLRGGTFDRVDFEGTDLRGTHFDEASLFLANFDWTQLQRASFVGVRDLDKCSFDAAIHFDTSWPEGFIPPGASEQRDVEQLEAWQQRLREKMRRRG